MTATGPAAASDERGFILVGVVMFMLALTILGLSLFALSSYEAQFFYGSISREQSLQSSESGLEVVKALLVHHKRLESAQLAVGEFGVTRAIAYQWRSSNANDTTSRGLVNWDSTIVIVVAARTGAEERTVQSRFVPVAVKNPYHQLISCGGRLSYNAFNDVGTVELRGQVWEPVKTAADTAWTALVSWPTGRPLDPSTPPTPLANTFVDDHSPAQPPTDFNLSTPAPAYITFDNPSPAPAYYGNVPLPSSGPIPPEQNWYEFVTDRDVTLNIRGTVVWLVGHGACFLKTLTVQGFGPNDPGNPNVLVIVAKPNLGDPADANRGIWLKGALDIVDPASAKVFLVSEGDISLTTYDDPGSSSDAAAVSVVAGGNVELMGPSSLSLLRLQYHSAMDAIADQLLANGALPPTSGGGKAFVFTPGSWLETERP